MIQLNELRIGNWVHRNGEPLLIDIDELELLLGGRWFYELSPIPLTPEILEKCWAIEDEEHAGLYSIHGYNFHFNEGKLVTKINMEYYIGVPIEYLHEFQNWIYALTGEELTVNLYDNDSE